MKTCEYDGPAFTESRSHPWVDAIGDTTCRYYDLTASPALIRTSLEDLLPWRHYAAIEDFYVLLERLNHARSPLESNDCLFTGPAKNDNAQVAKALQCSGRVMVLFRSLEQNIVGSRVEWLKDQLHLALEALDPKFSCGVVGTSIMPVRYLAVEGDEDCQLGSQLMLSFWAWGDSEAETMGNLARLLKNLSKALRQVSRHLSS
jgi:hypothetical protein